MALFLYSQIQIVCSDSNQERPQARVTGTLADFDRETRVIALDKVFGLSQTDLMDLILNVRAPKA